MLDIPVYPYFFSFFFLLPPGAARQVRGDSQSYNLHKLHAAAFLRRKCDDAACTRSGAFPEKIYGRMIGDKSTNRFVYYLIILTAFLHNRTL